MKKQLLTQTRGLLTALAAALVLTVTPAAQAAAICWVSNGNGTTGAGTAPSGTWGASAYWSTSSAGTSATANTTTTAAVDTLTLSAGTDATGS